jgi:Domain of Unknown Function (DUF1206)
MTQPLGKTPGGRMFLRLLARIGYAARGTVYVLTGMLAGLTAAGYRRESDDTQGALLLVHRSPFGDILLGALTIGLLAYASWSLLRAIFDPEGEARAPRGWMRRVSLFFTSIFYFGLAPLVIQTVRGLEEHDRGDRNARHWTARLMTFPLGRWAVAGIGIGFLVYVVNQLIRSRRPLAMDRLAIGKSAHRWVHWMIRFGIISRAIILALVGFFLVIAAIRYDAREVQGLNGAMRFVGREPAGRWLLVFVAAGFMAYGFYDLILCAYRVIDFSGAPRDR